MKRLFVFIVTLMSFGAIVAQNAKFGKPSKEEWDLKSVSFAPDAEAVVLYKSVEVAYTVAPGFSALGSSGDGSLDDNHIAASGTNKTINPDGCSMMYDVKLRTKILKDSGAGYSSLDLITLSDPEDMNVSDEFYEMSVVVFSNVDGKVKKRKIAGANIKDERVDSHYTIRHIRIPDVKAGDIIEYQYKLFSNRITYIYDTQLQESIPVVYAKCVMDIPHILQFNVNKPEIPNVSASAKLGQIIIKSPSNDMQPVRKVVTNVFTIEARNLKPYVGDIDLQKLTKGDVYCVRTELQDKRYDVKPDLSGPVRHMIIGK